MPNETNKPTTASAVTDQAEPIPVCRARETSEEEHAATIAELRFLLSPKP